MIAYAYVILRQFPKVERHVLSAEIRSSMYVVLKHTITAGKKYYKKNTLQELDVEIDFLRSLFRLAKDLKYINFRQYEMISKALNEIGAIVGKWINNIRSGT